MTARWPLLVVTFGAERRSIPFFWLRPRSTTWNCGLVKTPARPKIPGAAVLVPNVGNKSASSALALIAAPPVRFPVTGNWPEERVLGLLGSTAFGESGKLGSVPTPGPLVRPVVPPDPKAPWLPTLNGPSNQSKPSSFRLV